MKKLTSNLYVVGKTATYFEDKKNKHTPTNLKRGADDTGEFSSWGEDNLSPQNFFKQLIKVDAAVGGLDVLTSAHYGNGFKLYELQETENGIVKKERLPSSFPSVNDFFKITRWQIFMSDIIHDYETFNIAYPEYLLSPNFETIISVKRHKAANCRFAIPNEKNGLVEKIYINSDWENYNEDITEDVRVFDPTTPLAEIKEFCKKKKINRFIIPVIGTTTVEKIYPVVKWHSSFRNGWVDTVLSVPEFKKYMFVNQVNVKFLVYVADDFFSHKYGQERWKEFDDAEKDQLREELVKNIDEHMSGNESAGRSLVSPYFRDQNGNLIKGIEVEPIDDKIKDGAFLPDAASGNSQILFSMGVDPSLLGAGIPGGKNLSGSGSDKREAYTILCARMPIRRTRTLEIFDRIRDWNNWPSNLIGNFPNINLTTLDKNPNGQTEVVN